MSAEISLTGNPFWSGRLTRTQGRDLLSIYNKLVQVLYPIRKGAGREVLRFVTARKRRASSKANMCLLEIGTFGDRSSYA